MSLKREPGRMSDTRDAMIFRAAFRVQAARRACGGRATGTPYEVICVVGVHHAATSRGTGN